MNSPLDARRKLARQFVFVRLKPIWYDEQNVWHALCFHGVQVFGLDLARGCPDGPIDEELA